MLENSFSYKITEEKAIERIIDDPNLHINHMVLPKGEALPEHDTNSNVYMIIVRGTMDIRLADQESHQYEAGTILTIPYKTRMLAKNAGSETLEFFVVKAPNPKDMPR